MTSKLHQLIILIKKHGGFDSTNDLAKEAVISGICTRKTVYKYVPALKVHDDIFVEHKSGSDHWNYKDVTEPRSVTMRMELDHYEKYLKYAYSKIKKMKERTPSKDLQLMVEGIDFKREVVRQQQRIIRFETFGFRKPNLRIRFDKVKGALFKLDLDLSKALYKIEPSNAGDVFIRIDYMFSPESNRGDYF